MEAREPGRHLYTYEEFVRYAENQRCEWIDGVIYDMSGMSLTHNRIVTRFVVGLDACLAGKPCQMFHEAVEVRFTERNAPSANVMPDVLVVCDPEKIHEDAIIGAPTLIIEVLSPSTVGRDRVAKRRLYERHGVQEYWIVSPMERTVTVYTLLDGKYEDVLFESGTVESQCLPGFRMDLTALFENLI